MLHVSLHRTYHALLARKSIKKFTPEIAQIYTHIYFHRQVHYYYLIVKKNLQVLTAIVKLQTIKPYEQFFCGLELLNEDTRTDRQTGMAKLKCVF